MHIASMTSRAGKGLRWALGLGGALALLCNCAGGTEEESGGPVDAENPLEPSDGGRDANRDSEASVQDSSRPDSSSDGAAGHRPDAATQDGSGGSDAHGGSGGGLGGSGGGEEPDAQEPTCPQIDMEPNDTQVNARRLSDISDCDDDGTQLTGTLAPNDVDWFSFTGSDTTWCSVDPQFTVATSDNVTMCIYFDCQSGSEDVSCPSGSTARNGPNGKPGCCSSLSPLSPTLDCSGSSSETAQVWLQVSWPGNSTCKNYVIDYHY